jgi:hypothetical protein
MLITCLVYSLAVNMEAIWPTETLVKFYPTTFHYVPEVTAVGTSVPAQIIKLKSQFGLIAILIHLLAGGL